MAKFVTGSQHWDFQPFNGPLLVTPCEIPAAMRKTKESSDSQPELLR
jgi:hypothetical protein